MKKRFITACLFSVTIATATAQAPTSFRFDFGSGKVEKGYTAVLPTTQYSKEIGYGFTKEAQLTAENRQGENALTDDYCTSDKPFYFTVDVPEGNYDVKVILGDKSGESATMVRAESRRLMTGQVVTKAGQFETRTFTVNVRTPQIDGQQKVKLKVRELGYLNWDNQLTLEFNGPSPKVCAVEISRNDRATTVFLAGNSTVVDQDREPWAAWGQMIPSFFKSGAIAVANHAESGEALKSFVSEKRLEKIVSQMKAGDYLFIEFAHNDQKPGSAHVDPFTTYKEQLKLYISEARKKGGIPVLITSMHRRSFDSTGHIINTLGDYPEAMRQAASEEKVALIDLNAMSKVLYESWGPEASLKAFVHYPANSFPGQTEALKDNTHFSTYGAYEIARCVVEGIKANVPDLAKSLLADTPPFNPAQPDPLANWHWPLSPLITALKPDGN